MAQGIQLGNQYATAPAAAFAGMLGGDDEYNVRTMNNAGTASIPWGAPVIFKASPTTDRDASLPGTSGDVFAGILLQSNDYERTFTVQGPSGPATVGELDSTGAVVGAEIAVIYFGVVWVTSVTAVVRGSSQVWFSYGSGSTYTATGQIGATTDSSATQITNAVWESSCAAGGLAKLRLGNLVK